MKYSSYHFIYPPRPKNAIPDSELFFYDNMTLVSQAKMNGSNSTIYTDGDKVIVMNRHGDRLTNVKVLYDEILKLYRGSGWMAINCEYMNKSKKDENKKVNEWFFAHSHMLSMEATIKRQEEEIKKYKEFFSLMQELLPWKPSIHDKLI